MKYLLGLLVILNVSLLLWGMNRQGILSAEDAPGLPVNPDLIEMLPPRVPESNKTALIKPVDAVGAGSPGAETTPVVTPLGEGVPAEPGMEKPAPDNKVKPADNKTAPAVPYCLMIGPYDSDTERVRVSRQLDEMSISFTAHDDPKGRITGYRVYQGPFATDKAVKRARDDLGRKGITDLFLLHSGSQQYISLGFFSKQKSADEFAGSLRTRGVQARKRIDYATTYWLIIDNEVAAERLRKSRFPGYPADPAKSNRECRIVLGHPPS